MFAQTLAKKNANTEQLFSMYERETQGRCIIILILSLLCVGNIEIATNEKKKIPTH